MTDNRFELIPAEGESLESAQRRAFFEAVAHYEDALKAMEEALKAMTDERDELLEAVRRYEIVDRPLSLRFWWWIIRRTLRRPGA